MRRREFLRWAAFAVGGLSGWGRLGIARAGKEQNMSHADCLLHAFDYWEMPSDLPRPRLFLSPGDRARLPELVARYPDDWERLRQAADAALESGSGWGTTAAVGLAYLLSGGREYADRLMAAVERRLDEPDWVLTTHRAMGLTVDLGVAHSVAEVAWVYDWLHGELAPTQRSRWREAIIERGLSLFLRAHQGRTEWWADSLHNWRAVICGEMGAGAVALADEWHQARQALRESLLGVLATLDANPADGSYVEGLGYWSYGIGRTAWFAEALRALSDGAVNLFSHPYLQKTGQFALYMTTPDLGSFNFGDDRYAPPSGELLLLLAARTGDPHARWLADRLQTWTPFSLLWRADLPPPRPPDDLPLARTFARTGATVVRSDWSPEAVYLGLKTGETTANHSHLDINSVIVNAFGERLIVDAGIWHYDHAGGFFDTGSRRWDYPANSTEGHSTLLVDGRGQRCGERHRGEVTLMKAAPEYTYVVGEGAAAYGPEVKRFDRHLILAPSGRVLVVDDVELDEPRRLECLWQFAGQADLRDLDRGRIALSAERAALDLDLLWPDEAAGRTIRVVGLTSDYVPSWDAAPRRREQGFRYLSVSPLHRRARAVLVSVLAPRPSQAAPAEPARLIASEEGRVEVVLDGTRWALELRRRAVEQSSG